MIDVSLRLAAGALFLSAAALKARSFSGFVRYLATPFGKHARPIGFAVIMTEAAVGVALIALDRPAVGIAALLLLGAATCFLAVRFVLADETRCACWGSVDSRRGRVDTLNSVRPAWFFVRNGGLALAIYASTVQEAAGELEPVGLLAILGATWGVLVAGLLAATVQRRRERLADVHPRRSAMASRLAPLVALSWYEGERPSAGV